jgi:hypothetical protein
MEEHAPRPPPPRVPAPAGPLAEAFGAVEALIAGGLLALVVQVIALVMPGVWRLERLQPNSPRPSSGVEASA